MVNLALDKPTPARNKSISRNKSKTSPKISNLNKKGMFVLSGGRLFDSFNAMVFQLDLNDGRWKEITRLPNGALAHHASAIVRETSSQSKQQSYNYFVVGGQTGAHTGSISHPTHALAQQETPHQQALQPSARGN
jgi:hypothetical protein